MNSAIWKNTVESVRNYINEGNSINAYLDVDTILGKAVRYGRVEIVQILLNAGVDWTHNMFNTTIFDDIARYQQKSQKEIKEYKMIICSLKNMV